MTEHTIGDAPIEAAHRAQMRALAEAIDQVFNGPKGSERRVGFCLMVFPFGDAGRCNYISNAERADVVVMLREQLARFSGMPTGQGRG